MAQFVVHFALKNLTSEDKIKFFLQLHQDLGPNFGCVQWVTSPQWMRIACSTQMRMQLFIRIRGL